MPKLHSTSGKRNLISSRLVELRKKHSLSQQDLALRLQLVGCDVDKSVITRIENDKRFVTEIEIRALCHVFQISYEALMDGKED